MNINKLIAIAIAILINCAIIGALFGSGDTTVADATPAPAHTSNIPTLAPINVYPSAAELQALRQMRVRGG